MGLDFTYLQSFLSGFISAIILYQSAVVAGTVFKSLEQSQSRIFLRTIFPKFFKFIFILGLITLLISIITNSHYYQYIVSSVTIVFSFACVLIIPMTNRFKDEKNNKMFGYLHTLSVLMTMIILLLNISLIFVIYH
ncbi:MAG: hypothetical protein CMG59_06105 [Candidatus Marinimicrobia bacterium]|nr:hypothetical protein [Candidatus Neomarinimicrobiota bacterium]|tara:strand:+ start:697 stop:1104 length:408 start_codon:yes stop_codon:yes gene_type:complete